MKTLNDTMLMKDDKTSKYDINMFGLDQIVEMEMVHNNTISRKKPNKITKILSYTCLGAQLFFASLGIGCNTDNPSTRQTMTFRNQMSNGKYAEYLLMDGPGTDDHQITLGKEITEIELANDIEEGRNKGLPVVGTTYYLTLGGNNVKTSDSGHPYTIIKDSNGTVRGWVDYDGPYNSSIATSNASVFTIEGINETPYWDLLKRMLGSIGCKPNRTVSYNLNTGTDTETVRALRDHTIEESNKLGVFTFSATGGDHVINVSDDGMWTNYCKHLGINGSEVKIHGLTVEIKRYFMAENLGQMASEPGIHFNEDETFITNNAEYTGVTNEYFKMLNFLPLQFTVYK